MRLKIKSIHPFPARMAPSIVWDHLPETGITLSVLDPMVGSGTTLVTARAKGHNTFGCDTDPLALLISTAWCSDVDTNKVLLKAESVLKKARKDIKECHADQAYPVWADNETKEFMNFWFDTTNRKQLNALSGAIAELRGGAVKNILWCALSRLIITKKTGVSLAMDISHSRPHKVYEKAPIKPFDKFIEEVKRISNRAPFTYSTPRTLAPAPSIIKGDSRDIPFSTGTMDCIITSPPYLNAIDYMRGHKLSLVWIGYSLNKLRKIRSTNIGSETSGYPQCDKDANIFKAMGDIESLSPRTKGMMSKYIFDMDLAFKEMSRVLKETGQIILVIGNSTIAGKFIRNSEALKIIAKNHHLVVASEYERPLSENRRYLPPPSNKHGGISLNKRMKTEVILVFKKSCMLRAKSDTRCN